MDEHRLTRRGSLAAVGGLFAVAAGWKAAESEGAGVGPAAVASGAIACVLTPELTEGPYYVAGERVRRNITEGKPGVPLVLRTTVVNASNCKPIKGATVDIWHCDAGGVYSAFGAGASEPTFLRGIQPTNSKGVATFQSIYPGWYRGRAVHIHVKVHLGGNVVHTGQFFFPDALTDIVYRKAPYSSRPNRDMRNPDDAIYRNGGSKGMLKLTKSGSAYIAAVTMGVSRT
jgi:protocatechuate 3,4-dioxygenase beta subunit